MFYDCIGSLPYIVELPIPEMTIENSKLPRQSAYETRHQSLSHRDLLHSFEALFESEALTRAVLIDALVHKADGVMLLKQDGEMEIAFINATARDILQEADGLAFGNGGFTTTRLPETRQIQQSLSGLGNGAVLHARVLVTRPSGKAPYLVCTSPAPESFATQSKYCVVHIIDLAAQTALSKEAACATFGLSDREGDLAVELARGGSLKTAAMRAGMAVNTARNHIRSVFSKCHVHSQLELSRLLAKLT